MRWLRMGEDVRHFEVIWFAKLYLREVYLKEYIQFEGKWRDISKTRDSVSLLHSR